VGCFRCDPGVLRCLDPEVTGRIHTQDMKDAQQRLFRFLANREGVSEGSDALRLAHLDVSHAEGRKLREAAEWILSRLDAQANDEVSLEQIRAFRKGSAAAFPNGDGIVPLEDIPDQQTRAFCEDVVRYAGAVTDAAGKVGYTQEQLDAFLERARTMRAWMAQGRPLAGADQRASELLEWGDETPQAAALVFDLEAKIEQFFGQCDLLRVEPGAATQFELGAQELEEFDVGSAEAIEGRLRAAPLNRPNPAGELALDRGLNPHYEKRILRFRDEVLQRALGGDIQRLTREDWHKVKAIIAPYKAWCDSRPRDEIDALGEEKLRAYLEGDLPRSASELIDKDLEVKDQAEQISLLESLCLLQRWLLELANNFVNFSHLYDPNQRALFEEGTLVIDGRELAFTMKVTNRAEHKQIAAASRIFLVYAEVISKVTAPSEERFELVAAVTAGQQGGISVGKRGSFFDIEGREWDARIVDVIENPISLWEAIKAPFQRIGKIAAEKAEQIAAKDTMAVEKLTQTGLEKITTAPLAGGQPPPQPAAAPAQTTSVRDLLLGGGFAFAAVGSSLAFIIRTLSEINPLHAGMAVLGLGGIVVISSGLLGYLKLRARDMSAILEAAGWAVNFRMKLTRRLGRLFTRRPGLPKDAVKERRDLLEVFVSQIGEPSFRWRRAVTLTIGLLALLVTILALFRSEAVLRLWPA